MTQLYQIREVVASACPTCPQTGAIFEVLDPTVTLVARVPTTVVRTLELSCGNSECTARRGSPRECCVQGIARLALEGPYVGFSSIDDRSLGPHRTRYCHPRVTTAVQRSRGAPSFSPLGVPVLGRHIFTLHNHLNMTPCSRCHPCRETLVEKPPRDPCSVLLLSQSSPSSSPSAFGSGTSAGTSSPFSYPPAAVTRSVSSSR